ncbi:MAG TPA: hypothetical protein VME43_13265, partial [Bryobacteraceae bacterium]|nr:hypothetical protein [Bryobacteraceae bacterium]
MSGAPRPDWTAGPFRTRSLRRLRESRHDGRQDAFRAAKIRRFPIEREDPMSDSNLDFDFVVIGSGF